MKLTVLMRQLEGVLQEEQGAQARLLELIAEQRGAIVAGDRSGVDASAAAMEAELAREPGRRGRRADLVGRFGRAFGVAPELLTVSSIAERAEAAGESAERVSALRDELRAAVIDVQRQARKLSVLATEHGSLLSDVLRTIAGAEHGVAEGGLLVNAEA